MGSRSHSGCDLRGGTEVPKGELGGGSTGLLWASTTNEERGHHWLSQPQKAAPSHPALRPDSCSEKKQ